MTKTISGLLLLALLAAQTARGAEPQELWRDYKSGIVSPDGRVIDHYQDKASHSEGQGYGLLLAVAFDDKPTFDRIWLWTKDNLDHREDGLFAWLWGLRKTGAWGLIDPNNATDGDILIAMALLKADRKWGGGDYRARAVETVVAMRKNLTLTHRGRRYLLPSYYGFNHWAGPVVNPSYQIFSAFRLFATVDDRDYWEKMYLDSVDLVARSCLGILCLPADWEILDGDEVILHGDMKPHFGYNAVRTLLYLTTEPQASLPKGTGKLLDGYEKGGYLPLYVDLEDDTVSLKKASAGMYAVYGRAARKAGRVKLADRIMAEAERMIAADKESYYSFTLYLLSVAPGALE
jgi:endoglucanase